MVDTAEQEAADRRFKRLRVFNFVTGLVLLVQGLLMLVLSSDFSLPVTTHYLGNNIGRRIPMPVAREAARLQIVPSFAASRLLSATALLLIASPGIFNCYRRNLEKRINYGRWIE